MGRVRSFWTRSVFVLLEGSRRNYHLFCSTMGKSSTLHCEVQLLDDQSTVLDLDVSFFYFVNEYFGSKMVDVCSDKVLCLLILPTVCESV